MNSEHNKTSDAHRLLLNLSDKTDLKRMMNMLLYQISTSTTHENISKSHAKTINIKYQLQQYKISALKSLNYLMDYILYQIFQIILSILSKSIKKWLIILQQEYM